MLCAVSQCCQCCRNCNLLIFLQLLAASWLLLLVLWCCCSIAGYLLFCCQCSAFTTFYAHCTMILPMPLLSLHSPLVDWCFLLKDCPCSFCAIIDFAAVICCHHLCHLLLAAMFPMSLIFLLTVVSKFPLLMLACSFSLGLLFWLPSFTICMPSQLLLLPPINYWGFGIIFLFIVVESLPHAYCMWHQVIARVTSWLWLPMHTMICMQLLLCAA